MNEKGLCNINGVPDFVLAHNKLPFFFFFFSFVCFTCRYAYVTFSDGIID